MKKRNKKEYVVGFIGGKNVIYGPDDPQSGRSTYIDRMTINQARKKAQECHGKKVGVYKLVLEEVVEGQ